MPEAAMATPPDEGALLTMLAKLVGAERALEVGTFVGYGAISIARGLAEGGRLTCLELEEKWAEVARANLEDAGVADRVEIVVGPAEESLKRLPEDSGFDFVFLDADKTSYPTYYELIVPRMRPGGLLVIDNVLLGGGVIDPQSERERIVADLNDRITADDRVESVMIFNYLRGQDELSDVLRADRPAHATGRAASHRQRAARRGRDRPAERTGADRRRA